MFKWGAILFKTALVVMFSASLSSADYLYTGTNLLQPLAVIEPATSDSLFKSWRGPIMKWMGGIPINRSSANNMVAQTIDAFSKRDKLVIAVPPEGTRSKVDAWKTGFYYIALGAEIPIALAFLDYKLKSGGFLSTFYPTGDATGDIAEIRSRYIGISGKFADKCTVK